MKAIQNIFDQRPSVTNNNNEYKVINVKKLVDEGFLILARGIYNLYQVKQIQVNGPKSGLVYSGQVDDDDEPNGIGRYVQKDGTIFEGQMVMNPTVL